MSASPLRYLKSTRRRVGALLALIALAALAAGFLSRGLPGGTSAGVVQVRRETVSVRVMEPGVVKPVDSATYRSPLGRETEVAYLVPEGTTVKLGDVIARLNTAEIEIQLAQARQAVHQAEADIQSAEADREEALAAIESMSSGEKSLDVDEARLNVKTAEVRVDRLKKEHANLQALLESGYVTRDEIDRAATELEQAQGALDLARRRSAALVETSRPREERRARAQLAQRDARVKQTRERVAQAAQEQHLLEQQRAGCEIRARQAGVVIYEESLAASPRRKVQVGDRVTNAQGLITVSGTSRMVVESSIREVDVRGVEPGQRATILLDAYPDVRLPGRVSRVGVVARFASDRPFEAKRFDLIVAVDGAHPLLRPEISARVDILVQERRNVLVLPVTAVTMKNGRATVLRRSAGRFREVAVVTGWSDSYRVEIQSGLADGDWVALSADALRPEASAPATGGSGVAIR